MSVLKNVHMKFWQNDFVLGLTAEERYFYIYLITNSMTTQCGIYKFNRRLAELETGYSCDKIDVLLKKFEDYGKVIISKSTPEIMLVNWLKHNFKSNKKIVLSINIELKDVKDKELLEKLYDFCSKRQYPVSEIFSGVLLLNNEVEKANTIVKDLEETISGIQEETEGIVQKLEHLDLNPISEEGNTPVECTESNLTLTNDFLKFEDNPLRGEMKEVNEAEESLITEDYLEEDMEGVLEGTTIAFWGFSEHLEENKT